MFAVRLKAFDLTFLNVEEQKLPIVLELATDDKSKKFCLYVADERGTAYAFNIDELLKDEKRVFRGKNAMKRHNYYPHRGQYSSSNGIFYSIEELKEQISESIKLDEAQTIDMHQLTHSHWQVA